MKKAILVVLMIIGVTVVGKHSLAKAAIKIDNETVYKEAFHRPFKELRNASDRWLYKATTGLFSDH